MNDILITFESTTAVFRAKLYMENNMPMLVDEAHIVALPIEITNSCYGNGLSMKITDYDLSRLYKGLKDSEIAFKHFWSKDKENVWAIIDKTIEKKGKK